MRITLRLSKSVHDNAAIYYELAKEARKKRDGLIAAIEETQKEIEKAKKKSAVSKAVKIKREKQWFEKFHWFTTSGGRLCVGGRNAQQNDLVVSRHMEDSDLFFHADIQGGSALVLKDGVNASEQELAECAQFAACFSNAWKNANAAVDVYAVRKSQLAKHAQGGYVPTGAFAITGERKWFKNTKLALRVGLAKETKTIAIVPEISKSALELELRLVPSRSGKEKGAMAKELSKRFSVHPDEFLEILPNGKSKISDK